MRNETRRRTEGYVLIAKLSRPSLVSVLRAIAKAPAGPVVVHCNEGRERTGVVVATLLALVGVADDAIAADWCLSAPATMEASWIIDVLDFMRDAGGTVAGFLEDGGLTSAEIAALKARLVSGADVSVRGR